MDYETIKVTKESGIGYLTFARPQIHNAISVELMAESRDALQKLNEDNDVRVIVVSGEGRSFAPASISSRARCAIPRASMRGSSAIRKISISC
ncbi:enoyl-CoA hydratase/isomerase family protein [Ochrobactrum daejeonense]|nr:enoyl-CoA hydratase/isomerase family protein [Brucella daejeonensis]